MQSLGCSGEDRLPGALRVRRVTSREGASQVKEAIFKAAWDLPYATSHAAQRVIRDLWQKRRDSKLLIDRAISYSGRFRPRIRGLCVEQR